MILAVFHDFPGLENGLTKFHDFPGRVVTLVEQQDVATHSYEAKGATVVWNSLDFSAVTFTEYVQNLRMTKYG